MHKLPSRTIKVSVLLAIISALVLVNLSPSVSPSSHSSFNVDNPSAIYMQFYTVSFHETGLPKNASWSVNFYGTLTSTTPYVNFTTTYSNTSQTFSVSSPTFSNYQYLPTPSTGTVFVSDSSVNVSISFYNQTASTPTKGHDLNFSITNFPTVLPGVNWAWTATVTGVSLAYGPVTSSSYSTNKITYFSGLANGTYSYQVKSSYGTTVTPANGLVKVNGKNTTVDLKLSFPPKYTIRFNETGLPSNQKFIISVKDAPTGGSLYSDTNYTLASIGTSVDFQVINQTYYYSVSSTTGYNAHPGFGTVTVSGLSLNVTIQFAASAKAYPVEFKITNPPAKTAGVQWSWGVTVNGTFYGDSQNNTLQGITLATGSYSYIVSWSGISLSPLEGTFSVGNNSTTVLLKAVPTWNVNFAVSNLVSSPYGYPSFSLQVTMTVPVTGGGSINVASLSSTSGTATISALPNGSYFYTLSSSSSLYLLSPTSGTFTIKGANVTVDLKATSQVTYSVQFTESGLIPSSGTGWGVVVDNGFFYNDSTPIPHGGLSHVNAPGTVVESLPQGSYWVQAFVIDSGGNYHFMAPVHIQVGSSTQSYNMQFATATNSPPASLSSGYVIAIGVAAAAAIAGIVVFMMRRRKGPAS